MSQPAADDDAARLASRSGLEADEVRLLLAEGIKAKEHAYCPYSKFRVGAAVLLADRTGVKTGANVENASSPVGICAERVALSQAIASGCRQIKAIVVTSDVEPPVTPCGFCRQFLSEFCPRSMPVLMRGAKTCRVMTMEELLPASFGPEDLAK